MGLRFYLDGPKQIAGVDQTTPKSASNVINEHHQLFESYFHDSLLKGKTYWHAHHLRERGRLSLFFEQGKVKIRCGFH